MSFNTPLPNIAWKAFPAIFCGNAAVVKPSEHTPGVRVALRRARARGGCPGRRAQRRPRARRRSRRAARRAPRRRPRQLHGLGRDRALRSTRRRRAGSRRRASSSAARTRSSSATTPTSRTPSAGRSPRRSRTPASAAPRRAGSSSSTRSTTRSASDWSPRRRSLDPQPVISREALERILASLDEAGQPGRPSLAGGQRLERQGWYLAPTVVEGAAPDADDLAHGALRPRDRALPRVGTSTRRSSS